MPIKHIPFEVKCWLAGTFALLVTMIVKAGDAVTTVLTADSLTKDSLLSDTLKTAKKGGFLESLDENPFVKYTAMAIGIIAVVAFALFTSIRKNKPTGPPVGYRKPHTHHKHPR